MSQIQPESVRSVGSGLPSSSFPHSLPSPLSQNAFNRFSLPFILFSSLHVNVPCFLPSRRNAHMSVCLSIAAVGGGKRLTGENEGRKQALLSRAERERDFVSSTNISRQLRRRASSVAFSPIVFPSSDGREIFDR